MENIQLFLFGVCVGIGVMLFFSHMIHKQIEGIFSGLRDGLKNREPFSESESGPEK